MRADMRKSRSFPRYPCHSRPHENVSQHDEIAPNATHRGDAPGLPSHVSPAGRNDRSTLHRDRTPAPVKIERPRARGEAQHDCDHRAGSPLDFPSRSAPRARSDHSARNGPTIAIANSATSRRLVFHFRDAPSMKSLMPFILCVACGRRSSVRQLGRTMGHEEADCDGRPMIHAVARESSRAVAGSQRDRGRIRRAKQDPAQASLTVTRDVKS